MKKIINFLLLTAIIQHAFSQTETFDIVTYTPPKDPAGIGWKKDAKQGVVNYTNVNTTTGGFCVITLYASTASTGDAEKDFKKEWKELVATPYQAEANPKTETQTTADGWKVVTAAAPIKLDGNDLYILLTVASGFGKTMSIRTSLNDPSYTTQVDTLFETMELDKTKKSSMSNNNTAPVQTTGDFGKSDSYRIGLMMYKTPAGWSHQVFQDGVVFKPLDLPADEHLAMQIMQPLNASGNLEQAMAQSFEEATIMYKGTSMYQADGKYGKIEPHKSFNGWEYVRGKGGIQVENGTAYKTEVGLEVFVIKINSRFERVAILESRKYCGGVSRYYATDRVSYRNDIENFLFSLQFADFNAAVLKTGSVDGNGIVGIWQGIVQSTATAAFKIDTYSLIFLNNGQVYFGQNFPNEGFDGLNTRIPPERNRRDWKTYSFNNGKGNLNMIFADIPFKTQGDKIIVTKNQTDWSFFKLKSVDGARFSGTYTMSESYGIHPAITFTADGKFNDNGVVRTLYHDGNTCINPGVKPGAGNYEVKDYTITFNYSDGRKIKIAFMGTDYDKSNPSPATLRMSFNDDPMIR